jgi:allophanate hydrolase subunit 1
VSYIKSVVQNALSTTKSHNNEKSVVKLFRGLEEAVTGINSLTVTYADDATVAATLQVLNDRIKSELQLNT